MGRPCLCCCEDCKKCITKDDFDNKLDYALLICNINAARDDEFELYLNDVFFGPVSELGEDKCQGKWFVTSNDVLQNIVNSKNNPCNKDNIQPPECCYENTDSIQILTAEQKEAFFNENIKIFLNNTKNNNNGNFGYIGVWRVKSKKKVCQIATGNYNDFSGRDIFINFGKSQSICCQCNQYFNNGGLSVYLDYDMSKGLPHNAPDNYLFLFNPPGNVGPKLNPCALNLLVDYDFCDYETHAGNAFVECDELYNNSSDFGWQFVKAITDAPGISAIKPPEQTYCEVILDQSNNPPEYIDRETYAYSYSGSFSPCNNYVGFSTYRIFRKIDKIRSIFNIKNIYAPSTFTSMVKHNREFYYTYVILKYLSTYAKNYRWKRTRYITDSSGNLIFGAYYRPYLPLETDWRISLTAFAPLSFPYDYNGLFSCNQCYYGSSGDYIDPYSERDNLIRILSGFPSIGNTLYKKESHKQCYIEDIYSLTQDCECQELSQIFQIDFQTSDKTCVPYSILGQSLDANFISQQVLDTFSLNNIKMQYGGENLNNLS